MYKASPSLVGTTPTVGSQLDKNSILLNLDPSGFNPARFNPSDPITFKDSPKRSPKGAGLTVSHFTNSRRNSPIYPTSHASGIIKGQKINIKDKPKSYNMLGEFNLKNHFLRKLDELREMKKEYYHRVPAAIERLKSTTHMPDSAEGAKPWTRGKKP